MGCILSDEGELIMLFFHWTHESSQEPLKTGFNIYHNDESSYGFKFKLFRFYLLVRYAKMRKTHKWIISAKTWSGVEWCEELQTNTMVNLKEYVIL